MIDLNFTPFDVVDGERKHVGYTLAALRERAVPEPAILAGVIAALCVAVDAAAERLRGTVATPGSGQAMEYQEAYAQAVQALNAPAQATAVKYPMLAASIGVDRDPGTGALATDVLGVARAVSAANDAWTAFGAAIRKARLQGKAAITAAATVEAAAAAFDAIAWPAA